MASKQVIETNKLKIGSGAAKGLYVGNTESKYAVMTDANKAQTVIYDKVTYNFGVTDLSTTVPASGGTYTINASVSTRTHGNGAVDSVTFSPTSVTIPANTGSSYSSSVTVTQTTSNLTDAYNFTVAADAVKSIALSLGTPSVIPASGGSVNSCTTSATVTYNSGRKVTSFTPTQVKFNTVSANSKGTTVSNQTSAGTLTCYIVYGGVTSNTVSTTVYQQANAVTSSGCTEVTISSPSGNLGEIAASGGSKTPTKTATGGMAWSAYTSTSTAQTQSTISWSAVMTAANGFSVNTSTGVISASSKGTTMSNQTTSNTATLYAYTTANGQGRTASTTYYATQALNHIVSATATTSSTGTHISYANIPASATTAAKTTNGAVILKYSSDSTAKTTSNPTGASIAWNRTYTLASSSNGFTSVNSAGTLTATARGTTIGNARTSAKVTSVFTPVITHTSTYGGSVVSATSMTCEVTCTQEGNYVTGITVASQAIAYDTIPAGGGSKTPTGSNGTVTYAFSSKSTTTTTPASTYGTLTPSVSYAMTNSGRFTLKSTSTGEVSATTKGTTIENVTSSGTVTKTVSYTWAPASSYNAAGTKTCSGTTTTQVKQAGNYVSSLTVTVSPTLSYNSAIPASGGTTSPSGVVGGVSYNFTSGSNSTAAPNTTYGSLTTPTSYSMATGGDSRITLSSTSTGVLSGTTKGTTVVGVTSSGTVTKTVTYTWTPASGYNAGGTITKAGTATAKGTQAANAVVSYTDYQTPTGKSISSSQVPANGGTSTITWAGTAAQNAKAVYTSNATASTYTNVAPSVSTAVTGNSAVSSKGTTISNATTAIATVTGYYWANGKTASTTCSVTQAGNYVTSISVAGQAVSIANIPAGGGSKTPTGSNGTVTYTFSSTSTSTTTPGTTYGSISPSVSYAMSNTGRFTLKSTSTGEVSATTKGTTIENVTNANTLTKTVSYTWTPTASYNAAGTKTCSGSVGCTPKQDGNYVSSLTITTDPTISYASAIPASGGTITPSGAVGAVSYNFTSGSNSTTAPTSTYGSLTTPTTYAMATGGDSRITLSSTSTGALSGTSKGTTAVGVTSSGTVTKTVTYTWTPATSYNAGGTITKAGTATAKGTQAANAVTSYAWDNPVVTFSYPSGNIVASGGTKTPTVSATQSGTATYTSNSTAATSNTQFTYSYSMPASDGFTLNTSSGVVTAANRTTTLGNARTTNTITATATGAGSKTGTKTATVTQAANYVVSIAASGTSTNGAHFSYATAPASATTQAVTLNGTAKYTYSSGSVGTSAPASGTATYSRTYSLASSSNGFTAVNSAGTLTCTARGTTVGNARTSANITSVLTVTYVHPSGINGGTVTSPTYSKTNTCTQEGNYVTGITVASQALAYSTTIPASGGTSSPSGSNGTVTYAFTSKSTTTSTPASSAGSLTSSVSYAMTETGRFKKSSTNFATDGIVSATTKSTSIENVTSSDTVTKTVSYTWTPATSYNAAGTKTVSGSATSKAKQAGNYVSSLTVTTNPTISYASAIPAGGGTINPSGAVGAVSYNFTSGANSTSAPASTYGSLTTPTSYAMATGGDSRITLSSTSNGTLSGTTKGTTAVGVTSSGTVTKTVTYTWTPATSYNAGGTITKAGTATAKGTQAANEVTSYAWNNPVVTLTYPSGNIVAKGGTKSPTVSATQSGTATYTSTSTASTSNTQFTYSYAMTTADGFSINTTSGVVTAANRTTTIGNARNSGTVTVTATGAGSKTGTKTATVTQEGNYVTSISVSGQAVSIANIGAGGGSATPTGGNGTVTYTFTSTSTSTSNPGGTYGSLTSSVSYAMTATGRFTLKSTSTGEVSATTKGTTIENVTNANTLTKTVSYTWTPTTNYNAAGTKTCSGTATCTPKQDGNYVSSLVFTTNPTVVYSGAIPASGGTKSDSGTNGAIKVNYTSGSSGTTFPANTYGSSAVTATYAMTSGNGFTITTSNGVVSAGTKGTTVSNVTSSNTVTKTVTYTWTPSTSYSAGGTKTVSNNTATGTATQAANSHTDSWNNPVVTLSYPSGNIAAAGGTKSPTVSATQSGTATYTSTATATTSNTQFTYSYAMTAANGFTINTSTGVVTAANRTTTLGNARTSNAITVTATGAGSKTGTKTDVTVTQAANYVTAITPKASTGSSHFTYSNIAASATSATINGTGAGEYTFSSGSKLTDSSSVPSFGGSASYTRSTFSLSASQNGFTAVNSSTGALTATARGTTIGNARTSGTVTGRLVITYTHPSGVNGGTVTSSNYDSTATCTQEGNYVTGITVGTVTVTYAQFAASGGTKSDTGGNPTITYAYSSKSTGTSAPAETYGSLSTSVSYSMTAANGFTINTGTGAVTAADRGTTSGNARTSCAITKTVSCTWTPATSYNAAGTKSNSKSGSGSATQEANTLGTTLSDSGTSAYTVSVSIGSGMVASGGTATVTHSAGHTNYGKRTYTSGSKVDTAYTVSDSSTISITTNGNSRFSLNGNTLTHSNMTTNATTDTVVVTAKNSSNTSTTNTASKSITNAVTSTTWGDVTISDFSYNSLIPASGGTVLPVFTASQSGTNYYTSGSNAATNNTSWSASYSYTASGNFTRPIDYATTGKISAASLGTTFANVTYGPDVTLTLTGAGGKSATATANPAPAQAANIVTALTVSAGTVTFSTIPASGGTVTESGSDGKITGYVFSSGESTASRPGTTYGTTGKTFTSSMGSGNGFYLRVASTGEVSADSRGNTYSTTTRQSNQFTETVTWKFTHKPAYGGSVVSKSYTATGFVTQAANTTAYTYSSPSLSLEYMSVIPASGGSVTPRITATVDRTVTFASGNEGATLVQNLSTSVGMSASGRWSLKSSSTGQVSATSRGAAIGNTETSPTVTLYAWGTGVSGTASTTSDVSQGGNYVTAITVSTTCNFASIIPAGGGTCNESGGDADISRFYFTSGSSTASTPSTTYGSVSAQTSWSMTNGNGFTLNNYTVTAADRGTTTGGQRTSNTITETAKAWWIPTSSYNVAGTISGQTTDTDYCVQAANTLTETYGDITINEPSGAIDEIGAGGGTSTPAYSAWQACSKSYSSGSGASAWTNTTFTWTYDKSNNASLGTGFTFKTGGIISASTLGTTVSPGRTSSTVTATATANGKSKTSTYYATQEGNERTVTYGSIHITSPQAGSGSWLGEIPASGGSKTPTKSAWQACSDSYTSGAGSSAWTNTTFTWTYDKATGASLGTGFYLNDNVGTITGVTRGTTIGASRSSSNVTLYAAANGKTSSTYYYASQAANNVESVSASGVTISFTYNVGEIPASGGTVTTTAVMSSGKLWPYFTSGSYGTSANTSNGTSTYSVVSGGGSVNTGNGTLTVGANTGSYTITHKVRRTLSYCGKTVTTFDAIITQKSSTVNVTVTTSIPALNGGSYYGTILSNSNYALSSDFTIGTSEDLDVPNSGFIAKKGPAGTASVYGSSRLTSKPYMTIKKNGTYVASSLPADEWSGNSAVWHEPTVNVSIVPGDVIVADIGYS